MKSKHGATSRDQEVDQNQDSDLNQDGDEEREEEAFDAHRLHVAYGPKTTEALIEALFNPVKTSENRRESPFTYYKPKPKKESESKKPVGLGLTLPDSEGEKDATIRKRAGSNPTHITYQPQHPTIEGSMKKKKAGSVCSAVTTASTTSSSSASVPRRRRPSRRGRLHP